MKKLTKQRKVLLSVAVIGMGGVLFTGASAQSAGVTIVPTVVTVGQASYDNAPPKAPAIFDDTSYIVSSSLDASTVVFSDGEYVSIKTYYNGEAHLTTFEPTAECPSTSPITSTPGVSVSPDGKTLTFISSDPVYSCLAGVAPATAGTVRVWAARNVDNNWNLELVADQATTAVTTLPHSKALNGEVVFASDALLIPDAPLGVNVYVKNLSAGTLVRIGQNEQTGADRVIWGAGPVIVASTDGRFIGWPSPAHQTSRMLSDEAGNALTGLVIADRNGNGGANRDQANVKMRVVPSPNPLTAQAETGRSGKLLGFGPDSAGVPNVAIFNNGVSTFTYSLPKHELRNLNLLLTSISPDASYGFKRTITVSNYGTNATTNGTVYNLGTEPGVSAVSATTVSFPRVSIDVLSTDSVARDRIFIPSTFNGLTGTVIEVPLP